MTTVTDDNRTRLSKLGPEVLITAAEAAVICIRSTGWLEERRRAGKPPKPIVQDAPQGTRKATLLIGKADGTHASKAVERPTWSTSPVKYRKGDIDWLAENTTGTWDTYHRRIHRYRMVDSRITDHATDLAADVVVGSIAELLTQCSWASNDLLREAYDLFLDEQAEERQAIERAMALNQHDSLAGLLDGLGKDGETGKI